MTIMKKNEKSDCLFSIKQILKDVYHQGAKDHSEQSRESRDEYFNTMATKIVLQIRKDPLYKINDPMDSSVLKWWEL